MRVQLAGRGWVDLLNQVAEKQADGYKVTSTGGRSSGMGRTISLNMEKGAGEPFSNLSDKTEALVLKPARSFKRALDVIFTAQEKGLFVVPGSVKMVGSFHVDFLVAPVGKAAPKAAPKTEAKKAEPAKKPAAKKAPAKKAAPKAK